MCGCKLNRKLKSVDARKFASRDFLSLMKFTWCLDEDAFKEAFRKHGININDETDLDYLAEISNSGKDVSGDLVLDNKPVKFNVREIFSEIKVKRNSFKECMKYFSNIEELKHSDFVRL